MEACLRLFEHDLHFSIHYSLVTPVLAFPPSLMEKGMTRIALALPLIAALVGISASADAAPLVQQIEIKPAVELVAGGCGPGRWRGPYGACRSTPYYGPLPGGWYQPAPHPIVFLGCPPGYWRGPWGHCRNTPYHGPLPGGGWKP